MQKVSANPQLVRKPREAFETIGKNTFIIAAVLLIGTYICMLLPIVNSSESSIGTLLESFIVLFAAVGMPLIASVFFFVHFAKKKSPFLLISGIATTLAFVTMVVLTIVTAVTNLTVTPEGDVLAAVVKSAGVIGCDIAMSVIIKVMAIFIGVVAITFARKYMLELMQCFGVICIAIGVWFIFAGVGMWALVTTCAALLLPALTALMFFRTYRKTGSGFAKTWGIVALVELGLALALVLVSEFFLNSDSVAVLLTTIVSVVMAGLVVLGGLVSAIVSLVYGVKKQNKWFKILGIASLVVIVLALVRMILTLFLSVGIDIHQFVERVVDDFRTPYVLASDAVTGITESCLAGIALQTAKVGSSANLVMMLGAMIMMLIGAVIFFINRYKNKIMLAISASLNFIAIVLIFLATVNLAGYDFGPGKNFSYTIAALCLLFPAAFLYLNVFQYIKGYGKYGFTFVLPFFLTFAIFQLYPIYFTFRTSLTNAEGWAMVLNNEIIGFDNFKKLFTFNEEIGQKLWEGTGATAGQITSYIKVTENFWGSFKNTVIMWVFNFVPQISMALLLASWFTDTRMRLKFQGGFKVMIFMPNIITAATIGMLFMSLFGYPIAPVNTLLQNMGILNEPFEYWRNTAVSRGIVSFIQWWMWYGNTMIVMIAGILGINPSLFEAALVDGCSSRQTFWKITLPLIKPILLYNLVTSLVGGLTMFDIPHLMTQGAPDNTTNTVARFIYMQAFTGGNNFNVATAASVVLFIIIVICSLIMSAIMKDRTFKEKKRRAAK